MDIMKLAKEWGLPGIIGILIGIILVSWIGPHTPGGTAILIAVPLLIVVGLAQAIALVRKKLGNN